MIKKALPILMLLAVALFGLSTCEGGFVDPNVQEIAAVSGGDISGFGGYGGYGGGGGGGGSGGRLIINGMPAGDHHVYIASNLTQTPASQTALYRHIFPVYIAGNLGATTSPFSLTIFFPSDVPFTESGVFLVLLQGGAATNHYLNNVQFVNGSATINFADMMHVEALPRL